MLKFIQAEKFSDQSDHENSGTVWISSFGNTQISQEQREVSIIGPILKWKSEAQRPKWSCIYVSCLQDLLVYGISYRSSKGSFTSDEEIPGKATWQLVVPQSKREQILKMVHDHSMGGHLGEHKTLSDVRARFYWFGHWRNVHKWFSLCEVYANRKGPNKKNCGKMGHVKVGFPIERVALDIMGPLPRSDRESMLVLSDYFTKWMEAYPIPNQEAISIVRKVVEDFICRFGVPLAIHKIKNASSSQHCFKRRGTY